MLIFSPKDAESTEHESSATKSLTFRPCRFVWACGQKTSTSSPKAHIMKEHSRGELTRSITAAFAITRSNTKRRKFPIIYQRKKR